MTNALAGYRAVLGFSTSTGGSVTDIAEIRDYTIRLAHAPINAMSHDSSGDRELIAGTGQWTLQGSGLFVLANATHKAAFDLLKARTKVDMEAYPTGSSSDGYFSGSLFFTDFELAAPNEDALAYSVSAEGTGTLTRNSSA